METPAVRDCTAGTAPEKASDEDERASMLRSEGRSEARSDAGGGAQSRAAAPRRAGVPRGSGLRTL